MNLLPKLLLATAACIVHPAWGHGDAGHDTANSLTAKPEQKAWGVAADRRAATRTIEIVMSDAMRFAPDRIQVRQGETIRFVHRNRGKVRHEFVLGTNEELTAHAVMMQKFPDMHHDEPYMAHVAPGRTGEVNWTFNRAGSFEFACLVPGHLQAGMVGTVTVTEH